MSLLPLVLGELLNEINHPSNGIYDHDIYGLRKRTPSRLSFLSIPSSSGYLRPWRISKPSHSGVSNIHYDLKNFKVTLDVQHFKPEELKVKVADGFLIIEGKHDERSDEHGYVSRKFTRRYKLPKDVDDNKIISNISSDGILTIKAPSKITMPAIFYQDIPIVETNLPALISNGTTHTKKKEEKSLLPYYRNVPITQANEPVNKSKKEDKMEMEK